MHTLIALFEFFSRPEVKANIREDILIAIAVLVLALAFGIAGGIEHGTIWP